MPVVRISDELFKEVQKYAEPLVDNFETALWKALKSVNKSNVEVPVKMTTTRRANLTPQKEFRKPILEILVSKGGKAEAQAVVDGVESRMKSRLKPGDYEPNTDGTAKWFKAVHFQRLVMVHEGLLEHNSPRGIWQITERGRLWLSQ
ncbi:MAG: winged helix-turn-helix domain-containing protein [Dehalococcoidia bacterium]|nr:winged helix-turn-helix domain-containing protein [Dehalococcoidia bacterium]